MLQRKLFSKNLRLLSRAKHTITVRTYALNNTRSHCIAQKSSHKVFATPAAAVADIADGDTLLVGGFGLCGLWFGSRQCDF